MIAGVVCEEWTQPIFERHLSQAGYSFVRAPGPTQGSITLKVHTSNVEALGEVVKAAQAEAKQTGAPK